CPPCHSPYRDRQRNAQAFVPTPRCHTSGQSAYTHYSTSHTRRGVSATALHSGQPRSRLQRNGGIRPRFPHRHSGLVSEIPEPSSTVHRLISRLSSDNLSLFCSNVNRTYNRLERLKTSEYRTGKLLCLAKHL